MARFHLGIDGGGSVTRARLTDASGKPLGVGAAGPSNLRLGAEIAWSAVMAATQAALAEAGLPVAVIPDLEAGMGLAGACIGVAREAFLALPSPFARIVLDTDAHAACLGAHGGAPGGIVIVGTGSVAHVWDGAHGRQIGGWGFPISDLGSGAWLGLEVARLAVASLESAAPAASLARAVLQRLGGSGEAATLWSDAAGPAEFAALAPLVFDAAEAGDASATEILEQAAVHVTRLIDAVAALGATRIALLGGVAEPLKRYLQPAALAQLVPAQGSALDGALHMLRMTSATA